MTEKKKLSHRENLARQAKVEILQPVDVVVKPSGQKLGDHKF